MAKRKPKPEPTTTKGDSKKPTYFVPKAVQSSAQDITTAKYYRRAASASKDAPSGVVAAPVRDGCLWYGDEQENVPESYRAVGWAWDCPSCGVAPRVYHAWYCPRRVPLNMALDVWQEIPGRDRQIFFGVNHPWDVETYYRVGDAIAHNATSRRTIELFEMYRDVYGWETPLERARHAAAERTEAQQATVVRRAAKPVQRNFDNDDTDPF